MGIFKRKKKPLDEKKKSEKVANDNKFPYRVYLKEIEDNYTKKVVSFGAERFIDEERGTVMLRNETHKFSEPKPSNDNSYKIYKLIEIKKKVAVLEKDLAKEIKVDDPKVNRKDIEQELHLYKSYQRSLELQGKGSYLNIDEDGKPYYVFRRKGNFKLPEFDNVDIDTLYTPSESKIKKASELLEMKREKYSKFQRNAATLLVTFFVIQLLFLGGLVYWSFKLNTMSNDSAITQMQERIDDSGLYCAEKYGEAGENFYHSSLYVKNITETLVKDLYKDQSVIEGILPD